MRPSITRPRVLAVGVALTAALVAACNPQPPAPTPPTSLRPEPNEVVYNIPLTGAGALSADPFLANGVGVGRNVDTYQSAGIGPSGLNTAAPAGTPERFIDYPLLIELYPGFNPTTEERAAGVLPPGVTITEAQGLNNMARIAENFAAAGISLSELTYMRIYLDNPPGTERADYAGWNRAYRKFVANINRVTGEVIAAYQPVKVPNATRPARANIEVATLPVLGWLIEIEATGYYPGSSRAPVPGS
jgi:enamine deaminase RidA (YjgF/YER057c/UK114 family)